ncbi:hypothetical protein MLD38_018908 [Melastoma candidum]|uniref:Uncharacterized protein n=1 Tax=Melastoma candidum TaxID=119954 RepID=A0ACB9QYD2_9MYRT|nr:hypothetical protein MLD38_018908 [Melastoma candidum]
MRKLCPNYDREDGLETVLEVPIPEEMFAPSGHNAMYKSWQMMKAWMRPGNDKSSAAHVMASLFGDGKSSEVQMLLGVAGAPLIPLPISCGHEPGIAACDIKDHPIEASMARYIVQQYIASSGGEHALDSVGSMYAMGKVRMTASEFCDGEDGLIELSKNSHKLASKHKNKGRHNPSKGEGEMGGFVVWQKRPDLWCLELVVSGYKISAGSDGKVAWRQTPWHHSHASRGPPRPLRRFLQGLDPRSTANLFSNSVCIGEKTVNGEDCFVLKLEAESSALRRRSSSNLQIIRHTIWGYFGQRTGFLVQLEDSHLLRVRPSGASEGVYWETTMESLIQDYRIVDGVNIAHGGRTSVSLLRYGEHSEEHSRARMEEVWSIEEVDFNVRGLSMDCFLPPADLKKEEEGCGVSPRIFNDGQLQMSIGLRSASTRLNASKVAALDLYDSHGMEDE